MFGSVGSLLWKLWKCSEGMKLLEGGLHGPAWTCEMGSASLCIRPYGDPRGGFVFLPLEGLELRKVDIRLPGKGNSKTHGARPVH